jgi:cephalosporin-C deacetylase
VWQASEREPLTPTGPRPAKPMPYFDLPLPQLRAHVSAEAESPGLEGFWSETLEEARSVDLAATFVPATSPLRVVTTFDVTFAGFAGDPIRGWLHVPQGASTPLPCVVEFIGYGGGRGLSHQHVFWAAAGFAHFVMDTRGQGSSWSVGDTPDPNSGAAAYPGFMTRGILDPADYYYRRLFVDAVRAVDAARAHPAVDGDRVSVAGISQGGGLCIAVASLRDDVFAAVPEVPFLADIRRATKLIDTRPYSEIVRYLEVHRDSVDAVFRTLNLIDVALLARLARAPALFAVGLMDDICPPSTVYAAFNAYGGPKEIVEYPYNDHDGGGEFHQVAKADWLRAQLERPAASAEPHTA